MSFGCNARLDLCQSGAVGIALAFLNGMALRITINEKEGATGITLEGRLAGPWVEELRRAWSELAPRLRSRKVHINLRDLTYVDQQGKQILREIISEQDVELFASTPLTKRIVDEVSKTEAF